MHILHHLPEDITRFGLAVHFETEYGEQFDKFIHQEILFTNRHCPSKEVAVNSLKELITRHLIRGGHFFVEKKNVETCEMEVHIAKTGIDVLSMKDDYKAFHKLIIDNREISENNGYIGEEKTIKEGMAGIFLNDSRRFFGRISRVESSAGRGLKSTKFI